MPTTANDRIHYRVESEGGGRSPRHANAMLGAFARRIVLNQPLDFLAAASADVLRHLTPGATPFLDARSATSLPASAKDEWVFPKVRRRYLPLCTHRGDRRLRPPLLAARRTPTRDWRHARNPRRAEARRVGAPAGLKPTRCHQAAGAHGTAYWKLMRGLRSLRAARNRRKASAKCTIAITVSSHAHRPP